MPVVNGEGVWKWVAVTACAAIIGWGSNQFTDDNAAMYAAQESKLDLTRLEVRELSDRLIKVETLLQEVRDDLKEMSR